MRCRRRERRTRLSADVSFRMAIARTDTALASLLGEWQSDRHRTLQYWAFPKNVPERSRKLFRSKNFFGHLRFRITRKRFTVTYEGKSSSQPYRVIFHGAHRVILALALAEGQNSETFILTGAIPFTCLQERQTVSSSGAWKLTTR